MLVQADDVTLVMVASKSMPARKQDLQTKKWVDDPQGIPQQAYEYTFRDSMLNVLVLFSKEDLTKLEGKKGLLTLKVELNTFERKWKVGLFGFAPSK